MFIHTGVKAYSCDKCEKSYISSSGIWNHKKKCKGNQNKDHHSRKKSFQCKVCEKSFSLSGNLKRHMLVHTGEKPYSCEKCGKSFTSTTGLKYHEKRCKGQASSKQNDSASTSDIQFIDCGQPIKEEIKEESETEDEMNFVDDPLTVKNENCDELKTESVDYKETIKLEVKQEIQEIEDVDDPLSIGGDLRESSSVNSITCEEIKMEIDVQ